MTETVELTPMQIAARKHRKADMLMRGTYGEMNGGFHGCSIGCFAREIDPALPVNEISIVGHKLVADTYGYPEWLAYLQDRVFEGLPKKESPDWHVQIADAVAARKRDWSLILHGVHAAILRISLRFAGSASGAVQAVLDLHEQAAHGNLADVESWSAAESAARSAAESAAWSAAESAAWSAAESAAWSAARSAARSAAESAAWSAARSAARSAAESAARSAAWSAARSAAESAAESAAYIEIRDAVLREITADLTQ